VLLGTVLPSPGWDLLLRELGVQPVAAGHGRQIVAPREGGGRRGAVLVDLEGDGFTTQLPAAGTDLLSGEACAESVSVPSFGVCVIEYSA